MKFQTKLNKAVNNLIDQKIISGARCTMYGETTVAIILSHKDIKCRLEVLECFEPKSTIKDIQKQIVELKHKLIAV